MKPFGLLVLERSQNIERCANEVAALMDRYNGVSGSRPITLEQASWFAAIVYLGMQEAKKQIEAKKEGRIHTIVATDSMEAKDSAA